MDYKSLYENKDFGIIKFDEQLKNYTNFGIGGKADDCAPRAYIQVAWAIWRYK